MFKNEMKLNETDLAVDSYDRDGCNHVLLYTEGWMARRSLLFYSVVYLYATDKKKAKTNLVMS